MLLLPVTESAGATGLAARKAPHAVCIEALSHCVVLGHAGVPFPLPSGTPLRTTKRAIFP
jgi:hypothetical protein